MNEMTVFDQMIADAWAAENSKPDGPEFGALQRIISGSMARLYKTMPARDADEMIYRSSNYGGVSIGTAMEIQRRIILRMMGDAQSASAQSPTLEKL